MTSPEQRGLTALVAGWLPPGTYRCTTLAASAVRAVVPPGTWSVVLVDTAVQTRREALVALGAGLGCGPSYGANLDALWDCLRDVGDRADGGRVLLVWAGWSPLAAVDPDGLVAVLSVLRECAEEHGDLAVLLAGAGPDVPGVAPLEEPSVD